MIKKIEAFLQGNKLFIVGLISAAALDAQQYFDLAKIDYKVVAFSVIIAALSYAAKNLTGKIGSLIGILGTTLTNISVIATGVHVNIPLIASTTLLAALSVYSGGATSTKPPTDTK